MTTGSTRRVFRVLCWVLPFGAALSAGGCKLLKPSVKMAPCLDARMDNALAWNRTARVLRAGLRQAVLQQVPGSPAESRSRLSAALMEAEQLGTAAPHRAVWRARAFEAPPGMAGPEIVASRQATEAMWSSCRLACRELRCTGDAQGQANVWNREMFAAEAGSVPLRTGRTGRTEGTGRRGSERTDLTNSEDGDPTPSRPSEIPSPPSVPPSVLPSNPLAVPLAVPLSPPLGGGSRCQGARALTLPTQVQETLNPSRPSEVSGVVRVTRYAWPGPEDYYRVVLQAGQTVLFNLDDQGHFDSGLYVFTSCADPAGSALVGRDTTPRRGSVTLRVFISGVYYVAVESYRAGTGGAYTLTALARMGR